jgi:hypothetical protein
MFKPCRLRLIITSLITTRIMLGIRRCHFPLAGVEGIIVADGMVVVTVADGMAAVMAAAFTAVEVDGMAADKAVAFTAAGTAEKFVSAGNRLQLFEPFNLGSDRALLLATGTNFFGVSSVSSFTAPASRCRQGHKWS